MCRGIYQRLTVRVHHTGMNLFFQRWCRSGSLLALVGALAWPQGAPLAQQSKSVPVQVLPDLGDGAQMSPAAERRLGDSIVRSLYRDPDYVDDPVVMDYLQSLWQPLLAAGRLRGDLTAQLDETYAWELLLGRDRSVNAFALPGGYFGVHLGLVAIVSTRDELASVLGHELSHVTQRHIARNMAQQSAQAPWVMGAMILGVLAASKGGDGQAGSALITGGQAAAIQSQLNYSRDMEREADRVGFGVMTQAGFAPQGFVGMFEKLQQSNRLNDSGGFPYLRSHPLTSERISDMQNRMGAWPAAAPEAPAPWEPLMIAARARVLSNSGVDALRLWAADVQPSALVAKTAGQQAAALYGAAFAALKLRDYAQAQTLCALLEQQVRGHAAEARLARLLLAELAMAQGNAAGAMAALQAPAWGTERAPLGRAGLFLLLQAQTLSAQGPALDQASSTLRDWVAVHPRDSLGWRLLGATLEAQGRDVAAVRAQAQADLLRYDLSAALARLRAAQDLVRLGRWGRMGPDYLEAAIVDTRAREVTQLLREQALQR